jgi:hypothetical protein
MTSFLEITGFFRICFIYNRNEYKMQSVISGARGCIKDVSANFPVHKAASSEGGLLLKAGHAGCATGHKVKWITAK